MFVCVTKVITVEKYLFIELIQRRVRNTGNSVTNGFCSRSTT